MGRFGIRNYGPTRQIPYKGEQILMVNDGYIDTDDEVLASVLAEQEKIYVTDHGAAFAPMVTASEKPKADEAPDVPEDEISYEDMTVPELKVLAKDRELDVKGLKKAEIIEALQAYDATPDEPDGSEPSETTEPEEPDVSEEPEEKERQITVDDAEALHAENFPDENEKPEKKIPKKAKTSKKD